MSKLAKLNDPDSGLAEGVVLKGATSFWPRSPKLKPVVAGFVWSDVARPVVSFLPKLAKEKPTAAAWFCSADEEVAAGVSALWPRSPKSKEGFALAAGPGASLFGASLFALVPNPLKPLKAGVEFTSDAISFGLGARGWAKKSEAALVGAAALASFEPAIASAPPVLLAGGSATATPLDLDLVCEERIVLELELGARPPGWNCVSSSVGRSNMPAGMVLSLPKLIAESLAPPNGDEAGAGFVVGADAGVHAGLLWFWLIAGVEEELKPLKGAADGLAAATVDGPKPPKFNGEGAGDFAAGAAGAAVVVVPEAGTGVLPNPVKRLPAGFGDAAAAGAPKLPKFKGVAEAEGSTSEAAGAADEDARETAGEEPKQANGGDADFAEAAA